MQQNIISILLHIFFKHFVILDVRKYNFWGESRAASVSRLIYPFPATVHYSTPAVIVCIADERGLSRLLASLSTIYVTLAWGGRERAYDLPNTVLSVGKRN